MSDVRSRQGEVWLRPWRNTDASVVAAMATDPHLIRWSSLPTIGAEARLAEQMAGELSYWIVPAARGRGLAQAAIRALLPLAAEAGLKTVVLDIEVDNHASLRVATRLGAERRAPERVEPDRAGVLRTFAVHVLPVPSGPPGLVGA